MTRRRPLNDRDRELLALLREDGRLSWTEVARRLGVSRVAVQKRVEALEGAGWIEGFTVRIAGPAEDEPKVAATAFLRISFHQGMNCTKLYRRFGNNSMVRGAWSVAGDWDTVLLVHAERMDQISDFREIIAEGGGIKEIETQVVLNDLANSDMEMERSL